MIIYHFTTIILQQKTGIARHAMQGELDLHPGCSLGVPQSFCCIVVRLCGRDALRPPVHACMLSLHAVVALLAPHGRSARWVGTS